MSAVLAGLCPLLHAAEYKVQSPNGFNELVFSVDGEGVRYSLLRRGQAIITPTPIGLSVDGQKLPGKATMQIADTQVIDRQLAPPVPTLTKQIREHFRELRIDFAADISLRARAYDDGVAFRWELTGASDEVIIDHEQIDYAFARNFSGYLPDLSDNGPGDYFTHHEPNYHRKSLTDYPSETTTAVPFLIELDKGDWLLITDANVRSYPGLWLRGSGSTRLSSEFARFPTKTEYKGKHGNRPLERAPYIARTSGNRSLPWRAFVLTDAAGLLTTTMLYCLADPSEIADPSWIKPGLVVWDWWHDWNLYDVPFRAGINQTTYQYYIDFAAEIGAPYVILDEGWNLAGRENLLNVVPEIDMPKLVQYGRERGVGLILWMTSDEAELHFEQAFEQFSTWGIAGLKFDFIQRDDQPMIEFIERYVSEAAKRKMLVNIHGGPKPAGISRTWPNVLTIESVKGLEQSKWSTKANPEMATIIPFIRMPLGPVDYTPGAMVNIQEKSFKPMYTTPASMGTRCHQLAMYVLYLSPLQMISDIPMNYRANPESLAFIKDVPVIWDETRVLGAEVGAFAAVARRSGKDWYIGAITNWEGRELKLKLDFLTDQQHKITAYEDGLNADRNGLDHRVTNSTGNGSTVLTVKLAPGGGYAARITP